MRSTNLKIVTLMIIVLAGPFAVFAQIGALRVSGTVLDPAGRPLTGACVEFAPASGERLNAASGVDGRFSIALPARGIYTVRVEAAGFAAVSRKLDVSASVTNLNLRLEQLAGAAEEVIVAAGASEVSLTSPDPSEKVMVREELLDANPGRPGAPVSIPGLPIETASGGIKAPQYFVPGVAGDHGEPIAQYIAVGGYLVPNNLSANAHGNGYADPNILIASALGSVTTNGGAFDVLEGNHALNLAASYSLRSQLKRFVTLTGDYRDLDVAVGIAPSDSNKREWIALEVAYGNGLMERLEHRQQYKWNAMRVFNPGRHEITLASIGYYGSSFLEGLVPLGSGLAVHDTIDPRQRDQTHTTILAANDRWKTGASDEISFSGFFRTYNLTLDSNFGEGLIRQSEFRTVEGAEVRETHTFAPSLKAMGLHAMAGLAYNEDDPRRDNLDHYLSGDARVYGAFVKVMANDLTIRDLAPYVAFDGSVGKHLNFYVGLRRDQVEMKNVDLLKPEHSFDAWRGVDSPKATVAWTPGAGWLPSASFSMGQAFFTEDPRIGVAPSAAAGATAQAAPFEHARSEQLVVEKVFAGTDMRMTLGRTSTTATLAKIDADTGLSENLGPGLLKFLTASVRRQIWFGSLQGVFSKADARDVNTGGVTPEAPRTIFDGLAALDRLPFSLKARAEYEYVGHKLLDAGGFEAVPVGETRLAVVRAFLNGRLELGANGMLGRGYTGQTTETFTPEWKAGSAPPACAPSVNSIANDFDCGTVERSVGVRLPSSVGASISWRFGPEK